MPFYLGKAFADYNSSFAHRRRRDCTFEKKRKTISLSLFCPSVISSEKLCCSVSFPPIIFFRPRRQRRDEFGFFFLASPRGFDGNFRKKEEGARKAPLNFSQRRKSVLVVHAEEEGGSSEQQRKEERGKSLIGDFCVGNNREWWFLPYVFPHYLPSYRPTAVGNIWQARLFLSCRLPFPISVWSIDPNDDAAFGRRLVHIRCASKE